MTASERQEPNLAVVYRGVTIWSRYGLTRELTDLRKLVDGMDHKQQAVIMRLWVDSKACGVYSAELRRDIGAADAAALAQTIEDAALRHFHGHNGIYISRGDAMLADREPAWDMGGESA
jgi:hypothetical protein